MITECGNESCKSTNLRTVSDFRPYPKDDSPKQIVWLKCCNICNWETIDEEEMKHH